jgi:hypothetical protein
VAQHAQPTAEEVVARNEHLLRVAQHRQVLRVFAIRDVVGFEVRLDHAQAGRRTLLKVCVVELPNGPARRVGPRNDVVDVTELGGAAPGDLLGGLHHPVRSTLEEGGDEHVVAGRLVPGESPPLHLLREYPLEPQANDLLAESDPLCDLDQQHHEQRQHTLHTDA